MYLEVRTEAADRIHRTVDLLHARGYCLPLEDVARLCVGGRVPSEEAAAAAAMHPRLGMAQGRVHLHGEDAAASIARQSGHPRDSPAYWSQAKAYTRALARHCPWLDVAWVAGSMASGGFEEGDDIDFNLLVHDHAKYLSYLMALALSIPVSWRMRRRLHDRTTPLLPKVVCINVVWERRQARPFARTDEAMGMEMLLARPVHGHARLRRVYAENPRLLEVFPQLADVESPRGAAVSASWLHRAIGALTRPAWVRRVLDAAAYVVVHALHAYVRFHRRKRPDVRQHVEEMERHKAPYGILERPSKRMPGS